MSETETKSKTKQKAAAAGSAPEDRKKDLSQQIKALQAEAAEGDVVVGFRGEVFTLRDRKSVV